MKPSSPLFQYSKIWEQEIASALKGSIAIKCRSAAAAKKACWCGESFVTFALRTSIRSVMRREYCSDDSRRLRTWLSPISSHYLLLLLLRPHATTSRLTVSLLIAAENAAGGIEVRKIRMRTYEMFMNISTWFMR